MTKEEAIRMLVRIKERINFEVTDAQGKMDALNMAIRALSGSENPNKWIPVSERLPEIHNYMQEYIVTIKGNLIRTAFFTETNGESWWSIDNVIAWMPLPEPYKASPTGAESEVQI